MEHLLNGILLAAEKTPDQEGRDIVLSMLVVGLIFIGVIVLGGLTKMVSHRRHRS
jgi:hypothetical protein